MAQMCRLRVQLGGGAIVGPGLMTFYARTAGTGLPAAVLAFLNALATNFPTDLTWNVPNGGDLIEDTTGALAGTWSDGGGGAGAGTSTTGYVLGSGATVTWDTGAVSAGRHLKGRTFIVPIGKQDYDAHGMIDPAYVASLQSHATDLITAGGGNLVIWSRPKPARAGANGTLPAVAGSSHTITTASVSNVPTALRSRRT